MNSVNCGTPVAPLGANMAKPVSPDESLIQNVRDEQERTSGLIGMIESKLARVLEPGSDDERKGEARPGYCAALLNDIDALAQRQQGLNARLDALIKRLAI